ncbi:MAG TPA: VWA domain-containing protein [Bryobacteraceae bacterium]|nr:VWA domain-containing protein [Bryobacteraceae bacterium]
MLASVAIALALQSPTFRTSTRLVEVNVVVHDKNGPVGDLTKDDFIVTDRGKPRAITLFSRLAAHKTGDTPALPAGVFSNRPRRSNASPGSVTIVLLDALNTLYYGSAFVDLTGPTHTENQALGYGKLQLMKFVKDLDPQDRVAIYALGRSLRVLCDFTNDPAQLEKVLREYRDSSVTLAEVAEPPAAHLGATPEFDAAADSGNQKMAALANGDRLSETVAALLAIANHAADIPGRKNLVWLTASLPFTGPAVARLLSRANIAIYPVDARGLIASMNPFFQPNGLDAMQELADETGGRAFYNRNDLSTAIRTAVDDADISYTVGFHVDEASLDGRFHELKIRVTRPGVDVRYPSGYFALKEVSTAAQRQRDIRSTLASPLESSAIHLLAKVDRADRVLRIGGSIDLRDVQLALRDGVRKGAVEIFFVQQDALGNVLERTRNRLSLTLNEEQYGAYLKSGVLFRQDIQLKQGAATIRVLVGDPASANVGSLIIPMSQVK